MPTEMTLTFSGPYRFTEATNLPESKSGVYLWTIPIDEGYLVAYVGEAIDMCHRFSEHMMWQLGGGYEIYDVDELRSGQGLTKVYGNNGPSAKLNEFTKDISDTAWENLKSYCCFWAEVSGDKKTRQSVESALITSVRQSEHSRLLQNAKLSVKDHNAVELNCKLNWPDRVTVLGVPQTLEYGTDDN